MNIDRACINMDATTLIISVYSMHDHARGRSTTEWTNSATVLVFPLNNLLSTA